MTYFGFLLRFLFIPILIFLATTYWDNKNSRQITGFRNGHAVWAAIGVHILLAVIYTTPWDNYLVATGVWYYNPELVTGIVVGYVPIEEYTFFIVETILAGLWWWFLARRLSHLPLGEGSGVRENFIPNKRPVYLSTCVLLSLWLLSTYLFFFGTESWTYLSIILFWALPPIILQLLFGADILWHFRRLVFWSIFVGHIFR
jgi:lycopene cyclase domain-containing protein